MLLLSFILVRRYPVLLLEVEDRDGRGKEAVANRQIPLADADLQSLIYDSLTPCLALMYYISISANEANTLLILAP